jgi:hypothetical protein
MKSKLFLAACMLLTATIAAAAGHDYIVVEGVQPPAWVEHESGARDALVLGASLKNKDKVYTGANARALLRLADGSLIKLGENGTLALDDLDQQKVKVEKKIRSLVTATLDVLAGAFRFTTQALYKFRGDRDVKVHIVTVTAGIRGTDIWGKATDDGNTLALIEGKMTVTHDQEAFTMDHPMSVYTAPKVGEAKAASLEPEQLKKWALETEIVGGNGAILKAGKWKVYVGSADNQDDALLLYDKFRNAGYGATISPKKSEDGLAYRVRIAGLPSKSEAEILAKKLKDAGLAAEPTVALK